MVSGEASPLGLQTIIFSVCPHMASSLLYVGGEREREISSISSYKYTGVLE